MIKYQCPECRSEDLLIYSATAYKMNGGDFFCHSTKTHDDDAEVYCLKCDYKGVRKDVEEKNPTFRIVDEKTMLQVNQEDVITLPNGSEFTVHGVKKETKRKQAHISMIDGSGFEIDFFFIHLDGAIVHRWEKNA